MVLPRRVSSIHGPAVFEDFFSRYRIKVTDQPFSRRLQTLGFIRRA
jgi:hypothetical protein